MTYMSEGDVYVTFDTRCTEGGEREVHKQGVARNCILTLHMSTQQIHRYASRPNTTASIILALFLAGCARVGPLVRSQYSQLHSWCPATIHHLLPARSHNNIKEIQHIRPADASIFPIVLTRPSIETSYTSRTRWN